MWRNSSPSPPLSETMEEWGAWGRRSGCGCQEPLGSLGCGVSQALSRAAEIPHALFSGSFSKADPKTSRFPLETQYFLLPPGVSVLSSPFGARLARAWVSAASPPLLCPGLAPVSWLSGKLILALSPSPKKSIRCLRGCVPTQCFFGSSNTISAKVVQPQGDLFTNLNFYRLKLSCDTSQAGWKSGGISLRNDPAC